MNIAQYACQIFRSHHYDRIFARAIYKDGWVWIPEDILNESRPFDWPSEKLTLYLAARKSDILLYLSWKLGNFVLPVMELLFKGQFSRVYHFNSM